MMMNMLVNSASKLAEAAIKPSGVEFSTPPGGVADTGQSDRYSEAERAELKQAAQAFEAIFLRQMLKTMRSATPGETLFDNQGSEQFREMSDARLADNMAGSTGFGIAEMLLKQFGVTDMRLPGGLDLRHGSSDAAPSVTAPSSATSPSTTSSVTLLSSATSSSIVAQPPKDNGDGA